nr:MAG TPA: hypothetical protein [Caudoviricetes sp.]
MLCRKKISLGIPLANSRRCIRRNNAPGHPSCGLADAPVASLSMSPAHTFYPA